MNVSLDRLESLFTAAMQMPAGGRTAYLDQACADDPALRQRVEDLLRAEAAAGDFLRPPTEELCATAPESPLPQGPGTVIGPYRLLQQIGEGGMGTVYLAEQAEPVKRRVALKVIKPGMNSRQVIARFEAERQALALMDHVNIARVFDGGTTGNAQPFFVMELVHGVPITKYCDDNRLTLPERLELFVPVCQAIQHAHQKGVIHRDLKPANILVTLNDGKPVPKVIDFGVAKAVDQKLTDQTLFTHYGAMVGTLEYMSPEQAEITALGVDTRSDIYSLGVLLYELLTGSTPLTQDRLRLAEFSEILRMIKEEEPPMPSTRLKESGPDLPSISANRHTEPARLIRMVKGDLDWIVMKCLEKDRGRRYESASDLAADVQRYLKDEPVSASPPSAWYRLGKFARRHRVSLTTAGFVLMALLLGMALSISQAVRARRAEVLAESRYEAEKEARTQALVSLEEARRAEREKTEKLAFSYFNQSQARRWRGQAGRRFESLEFLRMAGELYRGLGPLDEQRILELRNEAIAGLVLADLKPGKEQGPPAGWSRPNGFHSIPQLYAVRPAVDDRPEQPDPGQGQLSVRRVEDDREIARLPGFGVRAVETRFSPDGRYLASTYEWGECHLHVWDIDRRETVLKAAPGRNYPSASFSPDGRRIALAQRDYLIRIYELSSGATWKALPSLSPVERVYFHPDGRSLAVVSGSVVQLRDLQAGKVLGTFRHPSTVYALAWRADGDMFATGCSDHDIHLWALGNSSRPLRVMSGHNGTVVHLAFSQGGDLLFSNSWDSTDRLWDPMTGRQLVSRPGGVFRQYLFGPDDRRLDDGWRVATGRECRTYHGQKFPGWVSVCPRGRLMASVSEVGVQIWDLAAGREADKLLHTLPVGTSMAVHFDPKGENLITASKQVGLQRWPIAADPGTGGLRIGPPQTLGPSAGAPLIGVDPDFALSPDGRIIAFSPQRGTVRLFDMDNPRRDLVIHGPLLRQAAFSSDGRWLATGNWQGRGVKLWDARTGKLEKELDLGELREGTAWPAFSPDGKWLVTGTYQEYRFWEAGSWRKKHTLPRTNAAQAMGWIAFSPDCRMVALLHDMTQVRLVDPATGREFARLPSAGQPYCFSPDGSRLVTYGGKDGAIHVWDLRLIRRQLAEMGLDWDLPPYPPLPGEIAKPLHLKVLTAKPVP